jgi:carboxypeptidase Q
MVAGRSSVGAMFPSLNVQFAPVGNSDCRPLPARNPAAMPLPTPVSRIPGPGVLLLALILARAPLLASEPPASAPTPAATDPIARIRDEGLNRSQVMATLLALTDLNGPRLTGSPGLRRAIEWSQRQLGTWGLSNVRVEPWSGFERGWALRRFSLQAFVPEATPIIAHPKAWSPSVPEGLIESEVVHVEIKKSADFERYRGRLRGRIVLDGSLVPMKVGFEPLATRKTDTQLLALANSDGVGSGVARPTTPGPLADPAQRSAIALTPQRYRFFAAEGVAALLQPSTKGEGGALFATAAVVYGPTNPPSPAEETPPAAGASAPPRGLSVWKRDCPPIIPQVIVAPEHYNRLVRLAQHGTPPRVALELSADYLLADVMAANVTAEIPGTARAAELVLLGAHLDSWHSGTGTTDNGTGCAVVLEAIRILQTLQLAPHRTIRLALWSGEEQGLLGSKAYVAQHFGEPLTAGTASSTRAGPPPIGVRQRKPAYDQVSAYYNLDNGGGRIRGIYLQGNEAVRGLFRDWLKPLRDLGAETVSLSRTGSTDHVSFDNIGLPGFQFIQDELEYRTRTWHGNMDVFDRAIADDLKQAAVVMATVVYQTAMRDEKIPRKPLSPEAVAAPPAADGRKSGRKSAPKRKSPANS